jgi:hypothetical protein
MGYQCFTAVGVYAKMSQEQPDIAWWNAFKDGHSLAQITVQNPFSNGRDAIEVGWVVRPGCKQLDPQCPFNDDLPHLFVFRTIGVQVAALAIILAWGIEALLEIIQGERTSTLKFISLVATIISTVLAGVANAVWRYLWARFPWIGRKTFPDLTGTWEGHLLSTWINPETGQPLPLIPTTIWIRQSLFTTSIKLRVGF